MKTCPHCNEAPQWYPSRLVSLREKRDFYMLRGCCHLDALFHHKWPAIAHEDRSEAEGKWDAEAERLFALYTARWDDIARARFREKLWPTPRPFVPTELFDARNEPMKPADIAAVKHWNETHPASDEGYFG